MRLQMKWDVNVYRDQTNLGGMTAVLLNSILEEYKSDCSSYSCVMLANPPYGLEIVIEDVPPDEDAHRCILQLLQRVVLEQPLSVMKKLASGETEIRIVLIWYVRGKSKKMVISTRSAPKLVPA